MSGSRLIGDAMVVIDTDQASGRLYKCGCGAREWSTWGNARKHSHVCPVAWLDGQVPEDHSDVRPVRGRAACPVCGRDVAWTAHGGTGNERSIARHKNREGSWCPAQRWTVGVCVSGQVTGEPFFYRRLER